MASTMSASWSVARWYTARDEGHAQVDCGRIPDFAGDLYITNLLLRGIQPLLSLLALKRLEWCLYFFRNRLSVSCEAFVCWNCYDMGPLKSWPQRSNIEKWSNESYIGNIFHDNAYLYPVCVTIVEDVGHFVFPIISLLSSLDCSIGCSCYQNTSGIARWLPGT